MEENTSDEIREPLIKPATGDTYLPSSSSPVPPLKDDDPEEENSPIKQVALTVPTTDDTSLPVLTFRMWVLGTLSCVLLSFLNQFFWYRTEPLSITAISAQIAVVPLGQLMAAKITDRVFFKGSRYEFTMNPGPFNVKEHVLITIFANSGAGTVYAIHVVTGVKIFYKQQMTFFVSLIVVLTTQVLGFGWAGIFRRYLVEPAEMWWPSNLVQVSLFRSTKDSELLRFKKRISRINKGSSFYSPLSHFFVKMSKKNGIEWSIKVEDGSSVVLEPEHKCGVMRLLDRLKGLVVGFMMRVWMFLKKAWNLGVEDPRKFYHCLKVGVALMVVSMFYYMRPLYDGVGGSAIWAVMTVVVVFEYTVGGTLYKCLNRICATLLAGFLALGIHWIASQSGHQFEPYIMGISLFILASATTFSRFIPVVKARFDYGCTIFILTYSLVSVSGYRVDHLLQVAHERLSTIIIGTCLCIITSMLVFPVWAGLELHHLIPRNMDKLAKSLDCCVAEYFGHDDEESKKCLEGYKCVLNSKASEESMANFARWEPAHGRFNFRHPWKNYLKVGASSRSCAYCIETLTSCLDSRIQVPGPIKNHLDSACMNLSASSSNVMGELATIVSTMTRSAKIGMAVQDMKNAVLELQNDLKSLPDLLIQPNEIERKEVAASDITVMPLIEVIPVVSFASLLIETASRIEENMVKAVEELAESAQFKQPKDETKPKQNQTISKIVSDEEKVIALQQV